MKLRFVIDRLGELFVVLLVALSIFVYLWTCIPYTPRGLKKVVEHEELFVSHCYNTNGEDKTTKRDFLFGTRTTAHEIFGRTACATMTFPRGSLQVLSVSRSEITIELHTPHVDMNYGPAYVMVREGLLPLERRIALSTRLNKTLHAACDAEVKTAGSTRVKRLLHDLSPRTKVTIRLASTNWCESGPVA